MRHTELRDRTKQFAVRVLKMFSQIPNNPAAQVLGKQVLRAGTSVAANFREASRARSDAEFISKLGLVEQELDETLLWLELLGESQVFSMAKLASLHDEAEELLKIVVTIIKNVKRRA